MGHSARAQWYGSLKEGEGKISTESGIIREAGYTFGNRFGTTPGPTPEELVAAAHVSCFTMALAAELERDGLKAEKIESSARVSLSKEGEGWRISESALTVTAQVPDAQLEQFHTIANRAKDNCPVSKLLNTHITLDAQLSVS